MPPSISKPAVAARAANSSRESSTLKEFPFFRGCFNSNPTRKARSEGDWVGISWLFLVIDGTPTKTVW